MKKGTKKKSVAAEVKRRINMNDNKGIEFIFWWMHINPCGIHYIATIRSAFVEKYPNYKKGTITSSMSAMKTLGYVTNENGKIRGAWRFTLQYLERLKPGGSGAMTPEELHSMFHVRKS